MKKIILVALLIGFSVSTSALAEGETFQVQKGFAEYKVTAQQKPASPAKVCPAKMDFIQQQISDAFVQYVGSRLTAEDFCKNGTIAQIAFTMKMAAREGRSYKGMKVNPNRLDDRAWEEVSKLSYWRFYGLNSALGGALVELYKASFIAAQMA